MDQPVDGEVRAGDVGIHRQRRRHLLIAGTGRTGTSPLVQYLNGLGLDTHLSKRGKAVEWFDSAQAGLEDLPLPERESDLPYVIKSPWSYHLIDQVLTAPNIQLDAMLVPIRDLIEAAASRTIVQLQAVHQDAAWMTQLPATWEDWGGAPGGSVFSLNAVDQARLLAVGLHRLLERVAHANVPIILLAFPRFATDADYLFRKLQGVLPFEVSISRAREVHAATFVPGKVRTERELNHETGSATGPSFVVLDNAAMRRELTRLRDQLTALQMSTSWRLTAPLRKIVGGVRNFLK